MPATRVDIYLEEKLKRKLFSYLALKGKKKSDGVSQILQEYLDGVDFPALQKELEEGEFAA